MSEQLELRVWAIGSTDAADKAKAEARRAGYRIQTVASIRPAPGSESVVDLHRTSAYWLVALAVNRPTSAMSEETLIAAYGGLGEAPIDV